MSSEIDTRDLLVYLDNHCIKQDAPTPKLVWILFYGDWC